MPTIFDIFKDESFRKFVSATLRENSKNPQYSFPDKFPILHRYTGLSKYSVSDIINGKITFANIGYFNDIFDGAIHNHDLNYNEESQAKKIWEFIESIQSMYGLIPSDSNKQAFMENQYRLSNSNKITNLSFLSKLGIYVLCLSQYNDSILMWAHYTNNEGICAAYDFNLLKGDLKHMIFPVSYTETPIIFEDMSDKEKLGIYPYEKSILCTALSKFDIWKYEQEWRIIFPYGYARSYFNVQEPHLPLNISIQPTRIYFGNRFLMPLFKSCENSDNDINEKYENIIKLLNHMKINNIPASFMLPTTGAYQLKPYNINVDTLLKFIEENFSKERMIRIGLYYAMYNKLLDIVYKENRND